MRIDIKKIKALSLTELLIVLAIVAILFAAMAPIVTKRNIVQSYENESVWNFVPNDSERNSYYDPGMLTWSSSAFVGMQPSLSEANPGKLVINSGDISYKGVSYPQHHIQFRYGAGRGVNAGSLILRDHNLILGTDSTSTRTYHNASAGLNAMRIPLNTASKMIAYGDSALAEANISGGNAHLVAIGDHAASPFASSSSSSASSGANTIIGAGAGKTNGIVKNNVAVGYNSMGNINYRASNNVFVGSQVGGGFLPSSASYNTIIGSLYSGNRNYNTVIGYKAFQNGAQDISGVTAIGYGACDSITSSFSGRNLCIGYNSAHYDTKSTPQSISGSEHIFIGGAPLITNGFGGRSILEVHRTPSGNDMNANVILNSNLVVRGDLYHYTTTFTPFSLNPLTSISTAQRINQCKSDFWTNDIYKKNDVYSAFLCKRDGITSLSEQPSRITPWTSSYYELPEQFVPDDYLGSYPDLISSDIRLKTNISENNDGLEKIIKIKPYNYTYKNDEKQIKQVGVIAQDLQKIFPNAVSKDEKGFLKIRWDEMFYALINSIKELNTKLVKISKDIFNIDKESKNIAKQQKDMKKRISSLNARINRLEKK